MPSPPLEGPPIPFCTPCPALDPCQNPVAEGMAEVQGRGAGAGGHCPGSCYGARAAPATLSTVQWGRMCSACGQAWGRLV